MSNNNDNNVVIGINDLVVAVQDAMKEDGINISKANLKTAFYYFIDGIKQSMIDGNAVRLIGFATFDTPVVPEKTVRNPLNGSALNVPEHRRIRVKISNVLKKDVAEAGV